MLSGALGPLYLLLTFAYACMAAVAFALAGNLADRADTRKQRARWLLARPLLSLAWPAWLVVGLGARGLVGGWRGGGRLVRAFSRTWREAELPVPRLPRRIRSGDLRPQQGALSEATEQRGGELSCLDD